MNHPSKYTLEQHFGGERLDASSIAHIETCESCSEFLQQLDADQQALLFGLPPDTFMARLCDEPHLAKSPLRPKRLVSFAGAGAVALLLGITAFLYIIRPFPNSSEGLPEEMAWKGQQPSVELFIHRNEKVIKTVREFVLPGDRLQYRIALPKNQTAHAALFLFEDGLFSPVFPGNKEQQSLQISDRFEFPGAVQIEKNTDDIMLLLVVRPNPFRSEEILNELHTEYKNTGIVTPVDGLIDIRRTKR